MIKHQFLTLPKMLDAPVAFYDFNALNPNQFGQYRESDLNRLLKTKERATASIIHQVIHEAHNRQGVMIFAATVDHAREIAGYLPEEQSGLVTGNTPIKERVSIIRQFKAKTIKYLVNVSVLTTGFDAPHVDLIAILRPTESVSLYQQIVGRGLRLAPGKTDCLIMEFAGNRYNLFSPEVGTPKPNSQAQPVEVPCPVCRFTNIFWGIMDQDNNLIEHFGRRCKGINEESGANEQCTFRFRFKECDKCLTENDIAARKCHGCNKVLVDPDQKLRDALNLNSCRVIRCSGMVFAHSKDKKDTDRIKITYYDEDGAELTEYFLLETPSQQSAFYHHFGKQALINRGEAFRAHSVMHIIAQQKKFRKPDFVIAVRQKHYWKICEKIYDYNGNYRKADNAS